MSTGISAVKSFVTGFFTDLMHGLPITRAIAFAHPIAAVGVAIGIGVITALAIKGIRAAISHYRAAHAVPAQV
ncbi:MAG: hypothetical protein HW387_1121 [Parachlamydiales bacterium]|nr:hypothetical protein [Parachlamydiales bacterium]